VAVCILALPAVGLTACGSSATTTTTTTTTTIPMPSSETVVYHRWCALKIRGAESSVAAAIGSAFRSGTGPTEVFRQQIPPGMSYQIWQTTDYYLVAFYVQHSIYSLVAFPRNIPPPVALGCTFKRIP